MKYLGGLTIDNAIEVATEELVEVFIADYERMQKVNPMTGNPIV